MHPLAAQLPVIGSAHQGGVLARYGGLVAVTVERPGLHLAFVQLAAVEQAMKWVQVVITLVSDLTDRGLELGGRQLRAHSSISMPSQAISQPALATVVRSGLSSRKAGLELLTCTNTHRATFKVVKAASEPSAPAIAI